MHCFGHRKLLATAAAQPFLQGTAAMAPKVAMKKAIGKVKAKARVKGKATNVVGKEKTKAMAKRNKTREVEDSVDTDSTAENVPSAAELRKFKAALQDPDAPKDKVAIVEAIKKLGYGQNKQKKYGEFCKAFIQGGWDHSKFNITESLSNSRSSQDSDQAVPKAIMMGMVGGKEAFVEALSNGDIEEVSHPEHPNKFFYRYKTFSESKGTTFQRTLKTDKGKDKHQAGLGLI